MGNGVGETIIRGIWLQNGFSQAYVNFKHWNLRPRLMQSGSKWLWYILHKCPKKNNSPKVSPVSCPHIPGSVKIHLTAIDHLAYVQSSLEHTVSCYPHNCPMMYEGLVGTASFSLIKDQGLRRSSSPSKTTQVVNETGPRLYTSAFLVLQTNRSHLSVVLWATW